MEKIEFLKLIRTKFLSKIIYYLPKLLYPLCFSGCCIFIIFYIIIDSYDDKSVAPRFRNHDGHKTHTRYYFQVLTSHVLYFAIWHSYVNQHYGKVLKFTQRLYEDKPSQELDREFIDYCTSLNWDYAAQHMLRNLPSKYPPAFRPF